MQKQLAALWPGMLIGIVQPDWCSFSVALLFAIAMQWQNHANQVALFPSAYQTMPFMQCFSNTERGSVARRNVGLTLCTS